MHTSTKRILVLGLIGLVGLVGWSAYRVFRSHPHDGPSRARVQLNTLGAKLEAFRFDHGRLPESLSELARPGDDDPRPYARPGELLDPWQAPVYYRLFEHDQSALIFSLGRDGLPGGNGVDLDLHVLVESEASPQERDSGR
jgi:general secretion pathway protein G